MSENTDVTDSGEEQQIDDIDFDEVDIEEIPDILRQRAEAEVDIAPVYGTMRANTLCEIAAVIDYVLYGEVQKYEFNRPTTKWPYSESGSESESDFIDEDELSELMKHNE
jgi:hypothetical protein